jgi:cytochrome c2
MKTPWRLIGLSLAVLIALSGGPWPAQAGGWAVATLDEIPAGVTAGQPFTIGFTMRQHGVRPVDWGPITLTFTHLASGQKVTETAFAESSAGHYTVDVTLPIVGAWEWIMGEGLPQPMPTLDVQAPAADSPAPVPALPWGLLIGLAGLSGSGLGLVAALRTRRPWAVALTAGAALVAGLGFVLLPPAPAASKTRDPGAPLTAAEHGQALFLAKGCAMCHAHTAVAEARRKTIGDFNSITTGPDLSQFSATPEYLRLWLANPAGVKPKTEMPTLGLSAADIESLIAFLNAPR